jgi:Uma2 family endonuclease
MAIQAEIVCARTRLIKRHPKVIIEVLSKTTAAVDTNDKLDEYETIAELDEYVLIDSRKPSVRIQRRNEKKLETESAAVAGIITLLSIGVTILFDDIYEDVTFSQADSSVRE